MSLPWVGIQRSDWQAAEGATDTRYVLRSVRCCVWDFLFIDVFIYLFVLNLKDAQSGVINFKHEFNLLRCYFSYEAYYDKCDVLT